METDFKVGRKVVSKGGSKFLKSGDTYTVKNVQTNQFNKSTFILVKESIDDRWFSIQNFKSLQEIRDEKIDQLLN